MDILIKGMKMKDYPQSITINPDGSVIKDTFGLHRPVEEWKAIELPPHGRLIDADRLKADNPQHMNADVPYVTEVTVAEIIDEAPTIVEASECPKK